MQSLKSHNKSERWLQALTQQNTRLQSPDSREVAAAKRAIRRATDDYLRSKQAEGPAQRQACMQKLHALAVARGLWADTLAPKPPPPAPRPKAPPKTPHAPTLHPESDVLAALGFAALTDLQAHLHGPTGRTVARKLERMLRARGRNDAVEFSHSLVEVLYMGFTSHPLSHSSLAVLGRALQAHLVPYLRSVRQLSDSKTWERARKLLHDQQRLGACAAAHGPGLPQILYWVPDVDTLTHYRAILTMAPQAHNRESPATAKFLRFLSAIEGPAQPFWAHHPVTLDLQDVGHYQCTCSSQKEHVARSLPNPGHELTLVFGPNVDVLVHGEYVQRLGPFLRGAATDIAHGVRRIYKEAVRQGSWRLLDDLFIAWKQQACINGKLHAMGEYLESTGLDDNLDVQDILELDNKLDDNAKCGEYLRVFARQQRRALAAAYGIDPTHVQRIERHRRFVTDYLNDEIFMTHLAATDFGRTKTPAQLRALVDYQIHELWVLHKKPRKKLTAR